MNYNESKVYLDSISKYGSVLGLENMIEMLDRLGNPQDDLKYVHISGTNGKGSVLSYVSTVLKEAGYVVGRYVSPTLFSYEERIQVNEEEITKEALSRFVTQISQVIDEMCAEGKTHPTVFEVETAISFLYFKEKKCDYVVLETGLGGLLDATNVVKTSVLEVITSISMDHMAILGDTLGKIAANKAGIIKENTRVVTTYQQHDALEVIEKVCIDKNAKLDIVDKNQIQDVRYGYLTQQLSYKEYRDITISLAGVYQIENAAIALEAIRALRDMGIAISDEAVYSGMKNAKWRGRFTVVDEKPLFIIDGAHNEAAAKVLKSSIEQYFAGRKITYIMGVFEDKDYRKIIELTHDMADKIIAIETPDNVRALSREKLRDVLLEYHDNVETAQSIDEAVDKSIKISEDEDVIIAFGSLSFLGDVVRVIESKR